MSSSKRLIKKDELKKQQENIYMDEHNHGEASVFLGETFEKKKQKMEEELQQWKLEETQKINDQMETLVRQGYEQGKETAYAEVFDQVMAENEKRMREEYDAKVEEARRIYQTASNFLIKTEQDIFQTKRKWVEQGEEELAEIIRLSVEKIIGRAVTIESDEIKKMLKETLSTSETKNKNVWVRVHPETKAIIEGKGLSEEQIELVPDPKLSMNDFVIETDSEWIDATIENKLKAFKKKIKDWIEKNEIFE